jgi:hypothetical protein
MGIDVKVREYSGIGSLKVEDKKKMTEELLPVT